MTPYFDLGGYNRPVTTTSQDAQQWFDRGLNWTYGYNHGEAIACFRKAIEADPNCAMAYWGVAYASGPNYNLPWNLLDPASRSDALSNAYDATQKALETSQNATAPEQALIAALSARYPQREIIDDMSCWNDAFANAMRSTLLAHPADLDVRAICAEALMNRTPWKMWDTATGDPTDGADTLECREILEEAMALDPSAMHHPGILHLYVHLMEMSAEPEKALKAADRLRDLVPDAGHLAHMPTHIDVQCGAYAEVVRWNERAIEADLKYLEREGPLNIYSGYRLHNYHFAIYGAMFLGQIEPARRALQGIRDTTPEDLLRIESPPMADYFESYLSFEPHILVRFGKWREAIALTLPDDQDLYVTLVANIHYARGVAHAALGEVAQAKAEELLFLEARARVPETRRLHNNSVVDLLEVARHMLRGEIAYRSGSFAEAFDELRAAVATDDALAYDEPWGWMQPPRHALGALLFEQNRIEEAEVAFREDLGLSNDLGRSRIHPDNVWALKGLYDCLIARDATDQADEIGLRLDIASARADIEVLAPCFCAQAAIANT